MSTETASEYTVPIEVIILNGTSSSGKSTLAQALQDLLDESWLVFGIDTLFRALPLSLLDIHEDATFRPLPEDHVAREGGISFDAEGAVTVGVEFRRLDDARLVGLAAIAETGTRLILDEVFLDGGETQERVRRTFAGRRVAWVGVTCEHAVAKQREIDRGDRVVVMVEQQSQIVHDGVHYDLVVDTTSRPTLELAHEIAQHLHLPTS